MNNIDRKSYRYLKQLVKSKSYVDPLRKTEYDIFRKHDFLTGRVVKEDNNNIWHEWTNELAARYVLDHKRENIIKWTLQIITYLLVVAGIVISLLSNKC